MRPLLFLLLMPTGLWAQIATDRWLEQTCLCFSSQSQAGLSTAVLSQQADSCAKSSLLTHYSALLKETKTDINNDSLVMKLGIRLGNLLYERCASYRDYFYQLGRAQLNEEVEQMPIATGYLLGLRREPDGRQFFWIRNAQDSIESFLWWREFDGSARFFEGLGDFAFKKVEIAWTALELYDADNQQYKTYPEIKWLYVLEEEPPLELTKKEKKNLAEQLKIKRKDFILMYKNRQK